MALERRTDHDRRRLAEAFSRAVLPARQRQHRRPSYAGASMVRVPETPLSLLDRAIADGPTSARNRASHISKALETSLAKALATSEDADLDSASINALAGEASLDSQTTSLLRAALRETSLLTPAIDANDPRAIGHARRLTELIGSAEAVLDLPHAEAFAMLYLLLCYEELPRDTLHENEGPLST